VLVYVSVYPVCICTGIEHWISIISWGDFCFWETFDNVWGHFWLSPLGPRGASSIQWDIAGHPTAPWTAHIIWPLDVNSAEVEQILAWVHTWSQQFLGWCGEDRQSWHFLYSIAVTRWLDLISPSRVIMGRKARVTGPQEAALMALTRHGPWCSVFPESTGGSRHSGPALFLGWHLLICT
jgi:hypothetical protein